MKENTKLSADELLRLYLTEPIKENCAQFLELLIENHTLPVIEKSLQTKFREFANKEFYLSPQDFEDVCSESCLRIVEKLSAMRTLTDPVPIRDFNGYAAVVAYNTWNKFLSDGAPNRRLLKSKIRYALDKELRLIVRTDGSHNSYRLLKQHCEPSALAGERLIAIVKEENGFFAPAELPDLLVLIFEKADGSLTIENLVKIVADLWQIRDTPAVSLDDFAEPVVPLPPIRREDFEIRCQIAYLWQEIRALPILQRVALLYNLRYENKGEMLFSFFNARIATLDELADAMNLTAAQFAKLLPQLPFDDKKIAAAMNLSVKQIGNLRKVARDNLRRRLDGKAKRRSAAEAAEFFTFIDDDEDGGTITGEFLN